MARTYSVINSVQAAGADVALTAGKLSATGAPSIVYKKISSYTDTPAVAETLQISTVTYSVSNNTTYSFFLRQIVANNIEKSAIITYTSDASATAAEIAAAISLLVTQNGFQITPSGVASPVTLTALTGYAKFDITAISNVTTATGTPGVVAKGTFAAASAVVAGLSNTSSVALTAGNTYSQYDFTYGASTTPGFSTIDRDSIEVHSLFVNEGDGDFAAFDTKLTELMNAFVPGLTTANPEAVSLI